MRGFGPQWFVLVLITLAITISYIFTIEKGSIRNESTRIENAQSVKTSPNRPQGPILEDGMRPEGLEESDRY